MQQRTCSSNEQSLGLSEELLSLIKRHLKILASTHYFTEIPKRILDDYVSSGETIGEAARDSRKNANVKQETVPFSIASIKWKLGQSGVV